MAHKVIAKTNLPNGTMIQLEDWHSCNSDAYPCLYGYTIGAYPICVNPSKYDFIRRNEKFRMSISRNEYRGRTDAVILALWVALCKGNVTLEELYKNFDEEKYAYYLGVIDEAPWNY